MIPHLNRLIRIGILLVSALAVTAIAQSGVITAAPGPEGIAWRLVEVGSVTVAPVSRPKQPSLTLNAAQKKVTGYSGCNNFFGTYEFDGASLRFGPIGATRRACPEPETAVETAFLKALERTRGWRLEAGVLVLLDGDKALARFSAASGGSDRADPASMTYRMRSLNSGSTTLVNGVYRTPAAPGSASEIVVKLTDKQAFGTAQGKEFGAVVLVASLGGTGSFYELALISRGPKGWENSDTVLLGDRVKVRSLAIENDRIAVALTTHDPQEPLCCPTRDEEKTFTVRDGRLVPAGEPSRNGEPRIVGRTWRWVRTQYNNDTTAAPAKPENYTVRFLDNGGIEIKADCNLKSGTYSLEGKTLSITVQRSTMAICAPGSLDEQFTRDLVAGAALFVKDGDLFIDLKFDTGTMRFSPTEED